MAVLILAWSIYIRITKGGLHSEDNTTTLLKDGLYGVTRHPSDLSGALIFITLPILLSRYVPFTLFSVVGILVITVTNYYASVKEEELNLRKWGEEYRAYMKEVPRWIGIPKTKKQ